VSLPAVQLWTDGACAGNPGPGGWASLLITGTTERMLSGGEGHTTNNRMELLAPIRGLEALTRPSVVDIYIDSTYVMFGFTKLWVAGWRSRAVDGVWRTSSRKPVRNQELWEELAKAGIRCRATPASSSTSAWTSKLSCNATCSPAGPADACRMSALVHGRQPRLQRRALGVVESVATSEPQ
jgi:ribonuclease HI